MPPSLVALIVLLAVVTCLVSLGMGTRRIRRRGRGGQAIASAMAAYDEAVHGTAHDSFVEVQTQQERGAARPARGDKP
jgi:hypothetical protein